jgi:hypothetical protein
MTTILSTGGFKTISECPCAKCRYVAYSAFMEPCLPCWGSAKWKRFSPVSKPGFSFSQKNEKGVNTDGKANGP